MTIDLKKAAAALFLIVSLQLMICIAAHGASSAPAGGSPGESGDKGGQSKSSEDGSLYNMAPSEFFRQAKVEEEIDLQKIDLSLLSAAIFHETNRKRKEHGKEQLKHLPRLDEASRMHARDMAEHEYVAHVNPREQELRTPLARVREAGLNDIRYVAENVASHFGIQYEEGKMVYPIEKEGKIEYYYERGGEPIASHTYRSFAETLVGNWMNSPGHRKNILSERAEYLGAGCSKGEADMGPTKFYCVQLFFDRLWE